MPEKSGEPPKFNIVEALSKEIGDREKKLNKGKDEDKDKGKENGKSKGKDEDNDTKDASFHAPERAGGSAHDGNEDPWKSQEEIVRLIGLRGYLEDDFLANQVLHGKTLVDMIGAIVEKHVGEAREKWTKRTRRTILWVTIIAICALVAYVFGFHTGTNAFPPWMPHIYTGG